MNITSFEVVDDVAAAGAAAIAGAVGEALAERERCALALSRGSGLFSALAAAGVPWDRVDVYQVDERSAPDGSSERNLTAMERELAEARIRAMPVVGDLDAGARAYEAVLGADVGSPPVLDVVHLGIGPDGHTASLVPGDAVLEIRDRWVGVTALYERYRRMTLTYPVLDAARRVIVAVSGQAKARAVALVRAGDASVPAGRLRCADVRFVADAAAAGTR